MPFRNPYHFLPLAAAKPEECLSGDDFKKRRLGAATHSRYTEDALSGRIVCRLTTVTPMVIGAERTKAAPSVVAPYEIGGVAAIPASSLRGMISHMAEAASSSAMRVLGNELYSFRRLAEKDALSAIGLVVAEADGTLSLKPLCLPTMDFGGGTRSLLRDGFQATMWPFPVLKFYLGDSATIRAAGFTLKTWHPVHNPVFHAIRRDSFTQLQFDGDALVRSGQLHTTGQNGRLAVAQQIDLVDGAGRDLRVGDLREWDRLPNKNDYVRGIVRVLGCNEADRPDLSKTKPKKHELFIPYPEELENHDFKLPIPPEVRRRFNVLAKLRSEESAKAVRQKHDWQGDEPPAGHGNGKLCPYEPRGTRPGRDVHHPDLELEAGDLVYFRPTPDGRAVAEVALSSIWRGLVEDSGHAAYTDEFFRKALQGGNGQRPGEDLLPMNPKRNRITIAEQLLGFVEMSRDGSELEGARSLAGRLRPSPALLESFVTAPPEGESAYLHDGHGEPQIMRILASPKPPSPSLYFRRRGNRPGWISASDLNPAAHLPQGRKHYLNHTSAVYETHLTGQPEEDRLRLKSAVTPVRQGAVYYFHVDFDNLSRVELSLLLYSLKPNPDFLHKIGMGKPLGLGSVKIEVAGVFFVDRRARYSPNGLLAGRYSRKFVPAGEDPQRWPDSRYRAEIEACGDKEVPPDTVPGPYQPDAAVGEAMRRLGKSYNNVSYPRAANQGAHPEDELFQWFVNNAHPKAHHQCLAPAAHGDSLGTLDEN